MTTPPAAFNFTSLDIIPDIHGQLDKLEALLYRLGYDRTGSSWSHPQRKVLFLGDYIDRGPKTRGTLHLVKNMVDEGSAIALMGNHEFNAIGFHSKDSSGQPLREHNSKNIQQHQATLDDFAGNESELADFIAWMKGLPMFLDLGSLRAVHACWCEKSISLLKGSTLEDDAFLIAANTEGTPEYVAIETILKGPQIPLPPHLAFADKDGQTRNELRVRWWGHEKKQQSVAEVAMPPGCSDSTDLIAPELFTSVPNYDPNSVPVFFGHYWMAPDWPQKPLANSICCLDFSAGTGGPLVAYRWDGEEELFASAFFSVERIEAAERHRAKWAEIERQVREEAHKKYPESPY